MRRGDAGLMSETGKDILGSHLQETPARRKVGAWRMAGDLSSYPIAFLTSLSIRQACIEEQE